MITVKNLDKYYYKGKKNEQHVLKNISLEFGNTGLVCILGESGSGKTTLLNTIGGLDDFSGGSINVADVTVTKYDPKVMEPVRNDRFGFIFQNYYLLNDYSVGYNVKLALNCYDFTEEEKEARVDYVLNMLGIGKYKKKNVSRLSGGQQQRVSIARVLVKAPDVIFADEPTGNLDEENTIRTMSILKNISKECLVLLVTHEKRIAKFFADRIIEIRDGEVVRDEPNKALASYDRIDDSNIYLPEYEETVLNGSYGEFRLFARGETVPLKLKLVLKDDKLYIENGTDLDIVIAGEESGVKILNTERAPLQQEDVINFDYDLSKPQGKKASKLPFKELWRMATENIKLMLKKQFFIPAILLATAVMLCLTLGEWLSSVYFDKDSVVSTDPHYVQVTFSNISAYNDSDQLQVLKYIWTSLEESDKGEVFCVPKISLFLLGRDFSQLKNLKQSVGGFCYVDLSHLDESTIIIGETAKNRNEAVVDVRILRNLMSSGKVVGSMYEKVQEFIGTRLATSIADTSLEIVGICDTGLPNIYCGQNILLSFDTYGYSIASYDEFTAQFPDIEVPATLADNEMLMRSGRLAALSLAVGDTYTLGNDKEHVYTITGMIPDDLGMDYVFSDKGCMYIRDLVIYKNKTALFYTDDKAAATEYINSSAAASMKVFTTTCTDPYETEVASYREKIAGDFGAKQLITVVIAAVALVMIYFSIKSNVYARSEELTVYRLIGISKGSITRTYMLEMALLWAFTTLPACLITWIVITALNNMPSLATGLVLPFWSILLLALGTLLVHVLICIVPVHSVLSKPPAALAVKE